MSDPKILRFLKVLTEKELIGFQNYLELPFIKDARSLQSLLEQLLILLKKNKLSVDCKIKIGTILYPSATDIVGKVDNQLSALKKQIEQYLIVLFFQKNPQAAKKLLPEVLDKRKATELYLQSIKKQEQQLTKNTTKDFHYYQALFDLHHRQHINPNLPAFSLTDNHAEIVMDSLDRSYVLTKLRYSAELYSKKTTINKQLTIYLLDAVQHLAASTWGDSNPLFRLYNQLLQYHQQPDASQGFHEFVQFTERQFPLLNKEEQIFIFYNLLNLANWRKRERVVGFDTILSDLHDIGQRHQLLEQNGIFDDTLFINIIINKGALKKFKEAKNLITTFSDMLPYKVQSIALLLSQCYLHFFEENYEDAIPLLEELKTPNSAYYCRSATLLINCYLGLYHQKKRKPIGLDKAISNFQKQISRYAEKGKINPDRLKSYKHFINIARGIKQYILKHADTWRVNPKYKTQLLNKLNQPHPVVNYDWLQQLIKNL